NRTKKRDKMDSLFEMIAFIGMLLISGAFGLFKQRMNNNHKEEETAAQQSLQPTPRTSYDQHFSQGGDHTSKTHQNRKSEEIEHRAKTMDKGHKAIVNTSSDAQMHLPNMKQNLTPQGLLNAIIMSEVLGPSRAQKPYMCMNVKRRQSMLKKSSHAAKACFVDRFFLVVILYCDSYK